MNIVVLAGGTSTERDVSIMTSMMVCGSLRRNGHHANMIDVFTGSGKYKHSSEFFQEDNDLKKALLDVMGWHYNAYTSNICLDAAHKINADTSLPIYVREEALRTILRIEK